MSGDICYACDGTGERNPFSGERCLECNGTGWREEREPEDLTDEEMQFWDDFYAESPADP